MILRILAAVAIVLAAVAAVAHAVIFDLKELTVDFTDETALLPKQSGPNLVGSRYQVTASGGTEERCVPGRDGCSPSHWHSGSLGVRPMPFLCAQRCIRFRPSSYSITGRKALQTLEMSMFDTRRTASIGLPGRSYSVQNNKAVRRRRIPAGTSRASFGSPIVNARSIVRFYPSTHGLLCPGRAMKGQPLVG